MFVCVGAELKLHVFMIDSFSLKAVSCLHKKCDLEVLCRVCTAFREKNSEVRSQIPISCQHCHGTCTITWSRKQCYETPTA